MPSSSASPSASASRASTSSSSSLSSSSASGVPVPSALNFGYGSMSSSLSGATASSSSSSSSFLSWDSTPKGFDCKFPQAFSTPFAVLAGLHRIDFFPELLEGLEDPRVGVPLVVLLTCNAMIDRRWVGFLHADQSSGTNLFGYRFDVSEIKRAEYFRGCVQAQDKNVS